MSSKSGQSPVERKAVMRKPADNRPRNRSSRPLTIDLRQISINSIDRLDSGPSHDSARLSATAIDSIDLTDFILDFSVFAYVFLPRDAH